MKETPCIEPMTKRLDETRLCLRKARLPEEMRGNFGLQREPCSWVRQDEP